MWANVDQHTIRSHIHSSDPSLLAYPKSTIANVQFGLVSSTAAVLHTFHHVFVSSDDFFDVYIPIAFAFVSKVLFFAPAA